MEWNWAFTWEILPSLLWATKSTILATIAGYILAMIGGLVFALLQRTESKLLGAIVREFIEIVRSTPLLLQIFFVYYVAPEFGLRLSPWVAGISTLGLHYSAYLSEVYRSSLDAVPRGQWEACRALNLSSRDTYIRIVIPQALATALPGMGNYLVSILKDTPMLSVIGVAELMLTANAIGSEHYRYLEPLTLVGIIFLLLSLPTASLVKRLENRLKKVLGL
ncbi:ectoine/hydroxyectoine ABC transporter permease subunit EhuD [Mesorhizobium sp. VK25A]|uniref:Ectoine/hydroxyectoine ABC transporter permease subunit EhuD n=1 Tax=Mesorhizobium vachelliae TaxID=3072309 RepID=A0ABU5AF57_9HYPH|nr:MULTISPECIES: ectoine/hydroxyectoine ABC transporter permease subunit EhuD [unclassified Mesorhizobium]MDX8535881.1 ectoine/hydroxyectoine ABC transporter permease subunit EhuD [Mesorhizobium sp. VK25D]MDX8548629.1 ectoine/hydroxyectoine ABC transporter permease subunit EhuD [Mesorhizobium sp. VK25A]